MYLHHNAPISHSESEAVGRNAARRAVKGYLPHVREKGAGSCSGVTNTTATTS